MSIPETNTSAKEQMRRILSEQLDDSSLLRELAFHRMIERGTKDSREGVGSLILTTLAVCASYKVPLATRGTWTGAKRGTPQSDRRCHLGPSFHAREKWSPLAALCKAGSTTFERSKINRSR